MRIVIVNKYVHVTGGADRHCLGLAEVLRERGHEVRFLSTEPDPPGGPAGSFVRARATHRSRDQLSRPERLVAAAFAFWNRDAAAAMRRLLQTFQPDVVHAHKLYPQLSVAPVAIAASAGIPVVQTLHDFEFVGASPIDSSGRRWDRDETRLSYRLLNSLMLPVRARIHVPRVRTFVAVSRFVADAYRSRGINSTVLPNFLPDGATPPATRTLGFDDRRGILFVGRMRPEKGVQDVLELAALAPELPVTMVGSGTLEQAARRAAASLPNLTVTGFLEPARIVGLLRAARLAVVPSRCEDAGPLAPIEAMAQGTPVVAYPGGGLTEYVEDSGAGRVVPRDARSLTRVCLELHSDARLWRTLSERAFEAAATTHSREQYGERIERVYEDARRR